MHYNILHDLNIQQYCCENLNYDMNIISQG